ncbi:MAG: hypothetical protein RLZZ336_488 [Cyanobacteriota bacterium]|jgi:hypothetical protein
MKSLTTGAVMLAVACGGMIATSGSAEAATSGLCFFNNAGGALPGTSCTGYSVQLDDKLFSVISAPSSGIGKVAWETSPPLPAQPSLWQVAIDWETFGLAGPVSGDFAYTVQITDPAQQFASIGLSTAGDYPGSGVDSTATKEVYQGLSPSGPLIDSVTSLDGGLSYSNPIGGTQIYVRDSWSVANGATIDNLSNYIRQSEVPGPLPVLGAVAGLGWCRRLKRRVALR